ncbi:hypothetical protein IHE44_0005769, partial [Lamprotornis superbus]
ALRRAGGVRARSPGVQEADVQQWGLTDHSSTSLFNKKYIRQREISDTLSSVSSEQLEGRTGEVWSWSFITYVGSKEERPKLQESVKDSHFYAFLTTYEMTQLLDVLQDYITYRGYSYERLDGSVRGEERHLAIKNFGQQPVFIFLLSTRAGGVGMNLTAADTVIFTDSDFNPQNDLQAIARVHRIRQHNEILKFGLDKLLSSEGSTIQDVDLENILGETKGGQWIMDTVLPQKEKNEEEDTENHMYMYEGKDYSKEPSREDKKTFDQLLDLQKALIEETSFREQSARRKHLLSEEGLEAQKKKRQEAAGKRARLMEEKKAAKAEAEHKKKMAWWEANHYTSTCLPSEESGSEEEFEEDELGQDVDLDNKDGDQNYIKYIMGDVTHPQAEEEDAIIVHCLDDSGCWGRGGLFTALEARSDQPRKIYEMAGKMKDLELGGTLLFSIDDKISRKKGQDLLALTVAQHRDRSNNLSGIKLSALEKDLKKIYLAAKKRNATVYLPRIGYATKGFNWYGTERLI